MSTPEDTSHGRDAVEPVAEEAIPDLEVTEKDAADQVKGGAARIQKPVHWFNGEKGY